VFRLGVTTVMKISFIGLGSMGLPIARNLLQAGHKLTVYNRTPSRADALKSIGATVGASPATAAQGADVLFTMVADDAALEDVMLGDRGALGALPRGAIHVSMSTISPRLARWLDERHRTAGQTYVAAPVFGRPEAAAAKKLWIVAAGPAAAIERCRPLFEAIGQGVLPAGEAPPRANVIKLAGNFLLAAAIEAMGEAVAFARKHDVAPADLLDVVNGHLFRSPIYENYGKIIAEERYEPAGFKLKYGLKDIRLALEAAEAVAAPMPFASLMRDRYISAIARGWEDIDWAGLARVAAVDAGL
jgi:3-hydroxyisobutyrate dehydrogenase-like beta-hydroxyacid dehydrogenase